MHFPDARILVFCKAPIPGQAKTRLIASLGPEGAARLHADLAARTLTMATGANAAPVELWCHPDTTHPFFGDASKRLRIPLYRQTGDDLGERMAYALEDALSRSRFAILIGTDCPVLEAEHLMQAVQSLVEGRDAVVGPAEDGGYVLIGVARAAPCLFRRMPWGTNTVLEETRKRLRDGGFAWSELPMLWDVDTPMDLERLRGQGKLQQPPR